MSVLKVLTCGSVDDGKSTLIGRIMYETNNLFEDYSEYLKKNKHKSEIDYSLLLDGLIDEKDQNITIDAAFKFLTINKRNVVFIDSPGHIEFTKNMAYASTFADVAILIVDSTKEITNQTKTHLEILNHLKTTKDVIVCLNKIDLIDYDNLKITEFKNEIEKLFESLDINLLRFIPISAKYGDNVVSLSKNIKEIKLEKSLVDELGNLSTKTIPEKTNTILSLQFQDKHNQERVYAAYQEYGSLSVGDKLINASTNEKITVEKIYFNLNETNELNENSNMIFTTMEEKNINSNDILIKNYEGILRTDSFNANIFWCSSNLYSQSSNYIFKFHYQESKGFISKIKNISNNSKNIINVNVELYNKLTISEYSDFFRLGSFLIIDPLTKESIGIGIVTHNLDKGFTIIESEIETYQNTHHNYPTLWFTGLSGSGKTTIANELAKLLKKDSIPYLVIDGDKVRNTINKDLGFSEADRIENNRRIANLAGVIWDAGILPIVTTISPLNQIRENSKDILINKNFKLIFIDTDLKECIKRNPKNLYLNENKKAKNVTGVDQPFEIPNKWDMKIKTESMKPDLAAKKLFEKFIF